MELSKAQRMLTGVAVGDALGAGYEGAHRGSRRLSAPMPYRYHSGIGIYTDDTQMSLAVAELMASDLPFNEETLASQLIYAYRRDKRNGYSSRTKHTLEHSWCGKDLLNMESVEERTGRRSDGSMMRAVPIGLLPAVEDVVACATINSAITHAHPAAICASIGIALASHYAYYNLGDHRDILGYVRNLMPPLHRSMLPYLDTVDNLNGVDFVTVLGRYADYGAPYDDARPVLGVVLFILKHCGWNVLEVVDHCVGFGGDVDTTMSMAVGIAMMNAMIDTTVFTLIDDLENGRYGRDHILRMGQTLAKKFPSP